MKLSELTDRLGLGPPPVRDAEVTAVTADSRRVARGALFFACKGERVDGHAFGVHAAAAGAVGIVGERASINEWEGLPYFHARDARQTLGIAAHLLAGNPTRSMTVIGVTGTNGKTSSVILIRRILEHAGYRAGCFGTLGYDLGDATLPAPHTTPFAEDLAALFHRAREKGVTHVAMEVSSHALDQERVAGIDFRAAVFTNLTQDHLDYHGDMERYRRAKLLLFERLDGPDRFAVVNTDDPSSGYFVDATRVPVITFGGKGDCQAEDVRVLRDRTVFRARTPWGASEIEMRLIGKHNVANVLGAVAVCGGLGIAPATAAEGIASLASVAGRFERVEAGQPFHVIVDYAHTEDGLINVLEAARSICENRLIVVFGCGGDRDKGKRPKMGQAAAERADFAIVTSDNPRTESPERILLDIEVGVQRAGKRKNEDYLIILDRGEAIRCALRMAKPGDLVLIAGKGHETYQIVGGERIHFDDREVARAVLEDL